MYALADLERMTGLTENQLRDRLNLLSPIVGDDLQRGSRGKILVGDRTLAALKRMIELEREGLSPKVAQSRIMAELTQPHPNGENGSGELWRRLLEEKDARIAQLAAENAWLRAKLDEALSRIPALPPAAPQITRWAALKIALLGR